MEVTPPPPRHFQYPVPPLLPCGSGGSSGSAAGRQATAGNGSATAAGSGRQYKAAKRGKNARKHASRPTTQPLAQRRFKRVTRRRRFSSRKRSTNTRKKRTLCSITIQKRKTVGKTHKNARVYEKKSLQCSVGGCIISSLATRAGRCGRVGRLITDS